MEIRSRVIMTMVAVGFVASACGTASAKQPTTTTTTSGASLAATAKTLFPQGITLVSTVPPGNSTYLGAAALQPYLQSILHVPVVVRPILGGGGNTGNQYVYTSAPNSGVLLVPFNVQLAVGQLVGSATYKTTDFTPLAGLFANDTAVYIAKYGSPYKNLKSLQQSKTPITIGVFGVKSSAGWMSALFLKGLNHVNATAVPFGNASASVNAVLSGAVDLASVTRDNALPLIAEKRAQAVIEFAPKPLSYLPGTESIAQVGSSSEAFYNYMGLVGPPNMSPAATRVLTQAMAIIEKEPAYRAKAKKLGLTPDYEDASAWATTLKDAYNQVQSHLSILK